VRWSLRFVTILGIDVRIHSTFVLLLAWIAWSHYRATQSVVAAVSGVVSVVLVFTSVLLHEYGHALVARRYGIPTKDITLLPIGGVARLERMPEEPRGELAVSIAGPAVNACLALTFFAAIRIVGRLDLPAHPLMPGTSLLEQLMWINVTLAVFNLVPAFPMDGGRVLRAVLAMKMGHPAATQVAATLGQGIALLAAIAGVFWNPVLLFVALFVWLGAAEEGKSNLLALAMEGIAVQDAMVRDVPVVAPTDPLETALALLLAGYEQDMPVVGGKTVVGVLTRQGIVRALSSHGPEVPIGEVMDTKFETAHPGELLSTAHRRMRQHECSSLPVVKYGGGVVGMLTTEAVGQHLVARAQERDATGAQA